METHDRTAHVAAHILGDPHIVERLIRAINGPDEPWDLDDGEQPSHDPQPTRSPVRRTGDAETAR